MQGDATCFMGRAPGPDKPAGALQASQQELSARCAQEDGGIPVLCSTLESLREHISKLQPGQSDPSHLLVVLAEAADGCKATVINLERQGQAEQLAVLLASAMSYIKQLLDWLRQADSTQWTVVTSCPPAARLTSCVMQIARSSLFNDRLAGVMGKEAFRAHGDDMRYCVSAMSQVACSLLMLVWQGILRPEVMGDDEHMQPSHSAARDGFHKLGSALHEGLLRLGADAMQALDNTALPTPLRSKKNVTITCKCMFDMLCKQLPLEVTQLLISTGPSSQCLKETVHLFASRLESDLQSFQANPQKERLQAMPTCGTHMYKLAERYPWACGDKTWRLLVEAGLVLHDCLTAGLNAALNTSTSPQVKAEGEVKAEVDSQGPAGPPQPSADMSACMAVLADKMDGKLGKALLCALAHVGSGSGRDRMGGATMEEGGGAEPQSLKAMLCDITSLCGRASLPVAARVSLAHSLLCNTAMLVTVTCPGTLKGLASHMLPWLLCTVSSQPHDQVDNTPAQGFPPPQALPRTITPSAVAECCLALLLAVSDAARTTSAMPHGAIATVCWDSALAELFMQLIKCAVCPHPGAAHLARGVLCAAVQQAGQDAQAQVVTLVCELLGDAAACAALEGCSGAADAAGAVGAGQPQGQGQRAGGYDGATAHLHRVRDLLASLVQVLPHAVLQPSLAPLLCEGFAAAVAEPSGACCQAVLWGSLGGAGQGLVPLKVMAQSMLHLQAPLQQALQHLVDPQLASVPDITHYLCTHVHWLLECMHAIVRLVARAPPGDTIAGSMFQAAYSAVHQVLSTCQHSSASPSPSVTAAALKLALLLCDTAPSEATASLVPAPILSASLATPACAPYVIALATHAAISTQPPPVALFREVQQSMLHQHWLLRHEVLSAVAMLAQHPRMPSSLVNQLILPCLNPHNKEVPNSQLGWALQTYGTGRVHERIRAAAAAAVEGGGQQQVAQALQQRLLGNQDRSAGHWLSTATTEQLTTLRSTAATLQQWSMQTQGSDGVKAGAAGPAAGGRLARLAAAAQGQQVQLKGQLEQLRGTVQQLAAGLAEARGGRHGGGGGGRGAQQGEGGVPAKEVFVRLAGDVASLVSASRSVAEQLQQLVHMAS